MKKIILLSFVLALFVMQQAFAVPAYPYPMSHKLPDGSEITIQLKGDEWVNWVVSTDGYTMLFNPDGFLEYAAKDRSGDLQLSGVRAHNKSERTIEEENFLRNLSKDLRYSSSQIDVKFQFRGVKDKFLQNSADKPQHTLSGMVRIPVILIQFQDKKFKKTKAEFEMLLNQENYTTSGLTGSLRDYYRANSFGKMDLQVDVFGPYTMPQNISSYAMPEHCPGGDPRNMARLAIDSAYHRGNCNFADYDPNNTDSVSTVHIIFAGYGTEANAPRCESIWSHAWWFEPPRTYNGKYIRRYSCTPELRNNTDSNTTHIGVIAHELGHSLCGLPDFYSVNGNAVDLDEWDVMASGVWNDNGRTPSYFSAYGRIHCGWVQEETISSRDNLTLPNPETTGGKVYRINTNTENEYFLLENRQKINWDAYTLGSGMMIYHVDKNHIGWLGNAVNSNLVDRGYYVKQAGCTEFLGCENNRDKDPYPTQTNTSFTDKSTPDSKSKAGINTDKPITDIVHNTSDRSITFKFMGGLSNGVDAMLTELLMPSNVIEGMQEVKVRIKNIGTQTLQSASFILNVYGADKEPYLWSGNLVGGASTVVTIDSIDLSSGIYAISVVVNIDGDIDPTNNTITKTVRVVAPIFIENWEESTANWTLANGSQVNKWLIDTATANGGQKSAYISNNGSANQYTFTSTNRVHLYCDIEFSTSTDSFDLFFDFKGMGESSGTRFFDYLDVRIIEPAVTPSAGVQLSSGVSLGSYQNVNTWQTIHKSLPASYSGTKKRLVFSWYNDNSDGNPPPAAIDNIVIAGIIIVPAPPTIRTVILPDDTVDKPYTARLVATGDTTIVWTLEDGNLPDGLNLFDDGKISGIPSKAGISTFTVKAANYLGSDTKELSITTVDISQTNIDDVVVNDGSYPLPLQAWVTGGILYIKGLTIGQPYRIYTLLGTLVYQGIAKADTETISISHTISQYNIYIIQSENRSVKVVY